MAPTSNSMVPNFPQAPGQGICHFAPKAAVFDTSTEQGKKRLDGRALARSTSFQCFYGSLFRLRFYCGATTSQCRHRGIWQLWLWQRLENSPRSWDLPCVKQGPAPRQQLFGFGEIQGRRLGELPMGSHSTVLPNEHLFACSAWHSESLSSWQGQGTIATFQGVKI